MTCGTENTRNLDFGQTKPRGQYLFLPANVDHRLIVTPRHSRSHSLSNLTTQKLAGMECSECNGRFREPKVFCCTRLCKACLQKHIDSSGERAEVMCLVCRACVTVPDKERPKDTWAEQFRTDGFLLRLQGAGGQISRKHDCFVCAGSRQESKEATVYCFDCDNYFCGACNQVHLQLRGFDSHSTGVLAELRLKDMMTRRRAFCSVHTSSHVDGFCRECNALLCKDCVHEKHRNCLVQPMSKIAKEKRKMLCDLKKEFEQIIKRMEDENEGRRDRETWMVTCAQQQREELELAFSRIEAAVAERKACLLAEVEENISNYQECHLKEGPFQTLVGTLKRNCALADEILGCGSDFDIMESADDLARQCCSLHEMSQKESTFGADIRRRKSPVDSFSVNTLITMIGTLGNDKIDQLVAFKTREVPVVMREDKASPSIVNILVVNSSILLVADSANRCIKSVASLRGERDCRLHRLDLDTRPRGMTLLKTHIAVVSGRQCLYIITITDEQLSIKVTVPTRKDYWDIASVNSINVAAISKQPPCIDIVDITGARLRTIEPLVAGETLLKQPSVVAAAANGTLFVTDRGNKTLACLDHLGRVHFVYRGDEREELKDPRGACVDERGCVFLLDSNDVYVISSQGKQMSKVLSGLLKPRAISVGADNVMAVAMEERGIVLFALNDMKGSHG